MDEYVENINPNKLFNMHLRYTPVRSDSVVGELKLSEPTDIILPGKQSNVAIPALLIIDIMYLINFMGLHFFWSGVWSFWTRSWKGRISFKYISFVMYLAW